MLAFASTTVLGQGFTFINPPTTTTLYSAPVTAPTSGLILPGTNLNALTGQPVIRPLTHRGGLRAQILTEGPIRIGDAVSV